MKKLLIILFTILSISLAAGCSDDSSSSNTNSTNQEQNGGSGNNNGNTGQGENGNGSGNNNGGNTENPQPNPDGNGNGGNDNNGNNGNGNENGNGGGAVVDPALKKLVDGIIGEYKVTAVIDKYGSIQQPDTDTPYVKINTQDYKTLLIEYKISLNEQDYINTKVLTTNIQKFIDTYMKKDSKGYDFKLPVEVLNKVVKMERTMQYQANHGLGSQGKSIIIDVNNGDVIKEDMPKNIPVLITSENIKNPTLKIYEAKGVSDNVEQYIFEVADLSIDDVTLLKFETGDSKVEGNTASYSVNAKESLKGPFPAYLFDVTTDSNANTFGILMVDIEQQ